MKAISKGREHVFHSQFILMHAFCFVVATSRLVRTKPMMNYKGWDLTLSLIQLFNQVTTTHQHHRFNWKKSPVHLLPKRLQNPEQDIQPLTVVFISNDWTIHTRRKILCKNTLELDSKGTNYGACIMKSEHAQLTFKSIKTDIFIPCDSCLPFSTFLRLVILNSCQSSSSYHVIIYHLWIVIHFINSYSITDMKLREGGF